MAGTCKRAPQTSAREANKLREIFLVHSISHDPVQQHLPAVCLQLECTSTAQCVQEGKGDLGCVACTSDFKCVAAYEKMSCSKNGKAGKCANKVCVPVSVTLGGRTA